MTGAIDDLNDEAFRQLVAERLAARADTISVEISDAVARRDAAAFGPRRDSRRGWLAGAAAVAILAGVGIVAFLATKPDEIATRSSPAARDTIQIVVYLDPGITVAQLAAVEAALRADPVIIEVTYVDLDATWRRFEEVFAEEDPELVATVRPEDLPTSFRVRVAAADEAAAFADRYRAMPGVYAVEAGSRSSPAAVLDVATTVPPVAGRAVHEVERVIDLPTSVEAPEGRWVISKSGQYEADGPPEADIALVDARTGAVKRVFPFGGLDPHGLLLTEDALYCARQGDGGVPDSLVCRIDRRTFDVVVRVFAGNGADGLDPALQARLPSSWLVSTYTLNAPFQSLALRDDGVIEATGRGPSLIIDPRTLEPLGPGECQKPPVLADQRLDVNDDIQLARILEWQPSTRTLRIDPVGWGGPTADSDFSVLDDARESIEVSVPEVLDMWLALSGGGEPALKRSDAAGLVELAAPGVNLAWLSFSRGSVDLICEQYTP